MSMIKLILVAILSTACMVFSQNRADRQANLKAAEEQKQAVARAQALVESLRYENLTRDQRRHYEVYAHVRKLRAEGKYRQKECFEPMYSPMGAYATQLHPLVQRAAQRLQLQAENLLKDGKEDSARRVLRQQELYQRMAKICEEMVAAYKSRTVSKMAASIRQYNDHAELMLNEGAKLPKREWLTEDEAELVYRIQEAGKRAARQQRIQEPGQKARQQQPKR
jgi:hypothetical protein